MRNTLKPFILILIFAFVLAACGGANNGNNVNNEKTGTDVEENSDQAANEAAETNETNETDANEPTSKSFEHAKGTAVIEGVPQKIVVLEWTYTENLLALGIQPIGAADIENYNKWVNVEPKLAEDVTDVGTRQEPNLERIAALEPDLIITEGIRVGESYDALSDIATTIVFDAYSEEAAKDPYAYMIQSFETMADIVDKKAEAEQILADLSTVYEAATASLEEAGKAGAEFVASQAFSAQNAVQLRLFSDNSMVVQIMQKLGLQNAFEAEVYSVNGFENATVEALAAVQDANFFYVVQDTDNVFENQLKDNAVWNGLNFVKEDRAYSLGGDLWLFGGPLSAELIAERATELLTQ